VEESGTVLTNFIRQFEAEEAVAGCAEEREQRNDPQMIEYQNGNSRFLASPEWDSFCGRCGIEVVSIKLEFEEVNALVVE